MADDPTPDVLGRGLDLASAVMRRDSEAWFPELHRRSDRELTNHYVMGLIGEAGEVANLAKKLNRDGVITEADLADELADVFTYLLLLAGHHDIDLLAAWAAKRLTNIARWGEPDAVYADTRPEP